jgi:hypothetical protein
LWPLIRDIALFLGGLAAGYHEVWVQHGERPTVLLLVAATLGLPVVLRADERKKNGP